jgi:hypothetical protein
VLKKITNKDLKSSQVSDVKSKIRGVAKMATPSLSSDHKARGSLSKKFRSGQVTIKAYSTEGKALLVEVEKYNKLIISASFTVGRCITSSKLFPGRMRGDEVSAVHHLRSIYL